jgi:hypothetical protein
MAGVVSSAHAQNAYFFGTIVKWLILGKRIYEPSWTPLIDFIFVFYASKCSMLAQLTIMHTIHCSLHSRISRLLKIKKWTSFSCSTQQITLYGPTRHTSHSTLNFTLPVSSFFWRYWETDTGFVIYASNYPYISSARKKVLCHTFFWSGLTTRTVCVSASLA